MQEQGIIGRKAAGKFMNAITFDTLASVKRMKAKGIQQEQAEAFAEELRVANDIDTSWLATKGDVEDLELKIAEAKAKTIKYMFTGFLGLAGLLVAVLFKLHG